jgi:Photosynthesis affected mutant 68
MSSESDRNRLPFEPGKTRKKAAKKEAAPHKPTEQPEATTPSEKTVSGKTKSTNKFSNANQPQAIPEEISKRMMRRMGIFCGTPTVLGIFSLVGSYFVVSRELFPLPNVAVLLVSGGCFGLGFLGITYGALSASWEEGETGSLLGVKEFQTNVGRMLSAWRESRKQTGGS